MRTSACQIFFPVGSGARNTSSAPNAFFQVSIASAQPSTVRCGVTLCSPSGIAFAMMSLQPCPIGARCALTWAERQREGLALRELEPLAGARPAVLLALHHPRVASEEAGLLQRRAEVGVELGQRAADAVPDGARLAGEPPAADVHGDVHLAELLHHLQRLLEDHLAR